MQRFRLTVAYDGTRFSGWQVQGSLPTVQALLEAEAASYHAPGTCTFYGTANTNQMVVEFMGLQLLLQKMVRF